jgi:DNA-directed RNA polymerase specialized sigma24 family protein
MNTISKNEMRELIATEQPALLKIARAVIRHKRNAEEVLQDVTLSTLRQVEAGLPRATNADEFRRWLRTITRLNARRRAGQPDRDVLQTAGEKNLQKLFKQCGSLRRFEVFNVCDTSDARRNTGRSKRRAYLNELDD